MATIGEKIQEARIEAGLTQRELARRLGIKPPNISQYERGVKTPKFETILRIADALGVDWEIFYPTSASVAALAAKAQKRDAGASALAALRFSQTGSEEPAAGLSPLDRALQARLLAAFCRLSETGKNEAVKRVEELAELPRYQAQDTAQTPPPARHDQV